MLKFKTFGIKLAEIGDGAGKAVPSKIQLMRVGNFASEEYGSFKITRETLATMLSNFEARVRGYEDGKLPIDYFHKNDEEAAGWIEKLTLEAEGNELWAEVSWTPRAAKMLADGEIRYTSAEFHFDYQDNESRKKHGPTLFGAGLTNRPFIKGMDAVIELAEGDENMMTLEQALAKIAELEKTITEMKSGAGDAEAAKKELADAKAKLGEYEAAEKKAAEEKAASETKAAEEKKLAEKTAAFDKMLAEGKACEAQREAFIAGDVMKFSELAQPIKLGASGNGGGAGEGGTGKTAQDEVLEKAQAVSKEKKMNLSESIASVLLSDEGLRKRYEKEVAIG
jgi:phage I-like protein